MLNLDSKQLVVLSGTAAAVLAGVYVLWGPSEKRKRKRDLCPGLVNLGNTCFLNSLLQSLAPSASTVQWLQDFRRKNEPAGGLLSLGSTLSHSLEVLNNESVEHTDEYNPIDVLDALRRRGWRISSDQQDAHELYHVITETLEEESSKFSSVPTLFDLNSIQEDECVYQTEDAAQSRSGTRLPVLPGKETEPYRGLLASQLQCTKCGHKCTVKYDTFSSLSLSIPSVHPGVLTLEYLLRKFVTSETVQDVECGGCSKSKKRKSVEELLQQQNRGDAGNHAASETEKKDEELKPKPKTTFIKKLTIGKLPASLCIHVQRTEWLDNGVSYKRHDHVAFPEILNMDNYIYHKRAPRPSCLDLDNRKGLVGGKKSLQEDCNGNRKKTPSPSPTVTSPYSAPVNLLKALNYTSRNTRNGFYVPTSNSKVTAVHKRPDEKDLSPSSCDTQVQRLAKAYSLETTGLANLNNSYKLNAVVVHLGDVSSGHFITYRRLSSNNGQRFPNTWMYTSDTNVKKVSLAEVLQAEAYMLFYERI